MNHEAIIEAIRSRCERSGENPDTYLTGCVHARPVNYWDYVQVDTLLSLQKPRTDFKDEEIFIMYHQLTELVLKMMLHEIRQMVEGDLPAEVWADKITRLNRYTSMLITSFDVMKYGMNYDDYNTFRHALAPASGFQSVQFRYIEICCTQPVNLLSDEGKKRLPELSAPGDYVEYMYWKEAGVNRQTGKKSLTLQQFEEKYQDDLVAWTEKVKGKTLEEKIMNMHSPPLELVDQLRQFDHLYNVIWPSVHLQTAQHYLDSKGEHKAATGGSEWKKYLHPQFQQRRFFPALWTETELQNWGTHP